MSPKSTDAFQILKKRLYKDNQERLLSLEEERANMSVANQLYELRIRHGLSQGELAKMVGTTASVISRFENAEYEGHSLGMLRRVANAMDQEVRIVFESKKEKRSSRRVVNGAETSGDIADTRKKTAKLKGTIDDKIKRTKAKAAKKRR